MGCGVERLGWRVGRSWLSSEVGRCMDYWTCASLREKVVDSDRYRHNISRVYYRKQYDCTWYSLQKLLECLRHITHRSCLPQRRLDSSLILTQTLQEFLSVPSDQIQMLSYSRSWRLR